LISEFKSKIQELTHDVSYYKNASDELKLKNEEFSNEIEVLKDKEMD